MTIAELLSNPRYELPLFRNNDNFCAYAKELLDSYLSAIQQLDSADPVGSLVQAEFSKIKSFSYDALHAIERYHDGYPSQAYHSFAKGMDNLKHELIPKIFHGIAEDYNFMYRARVHAVPLAEKYDIFHVPFNQRHNISTSRYSIPGLPCLYLSGNLYTCWVEMGCVPFHELQVSSFWTPWNGNLSVLDLAVSPQQLMKTLATDTSGAMNHSLALHIASHVLLWPLKALCSIRVMQKQGHFKPEYIIPQLLLQWLRLGFQCDGIKYMSTRNEALASNRTATINYVFPVKEVGSTGHCPRLSEQFQWTRPIPWMLLDAISGATDAQIQGDRDYEMDFIVGHPKLYSTMVFGRVENELNRIANLEHSRLTAESKAAIALRYENSNKASPN